jgi:hypothetical protein
MAPKKKKNVGVAGSRKRKNVAPAKVIDEVETDSTNEPAAPTSPSPHSPSLPPQLEDDLNAPAPAPALEASTSTSRQLHVVGTVTEFRGAPTKKAKGL